MKGGNYRKCKSKEYTFRGEKWKHFMKNYEMQKINEWNKEWILGND